MSDHTGDSLIKMIDEAQRHGWGIVGISDKPFGRKLISPKRWRDICQQLRHRDELLEALKDLVTDYEEIGGEDIYANSYRIAKHVIANAPD